MHGSSQQCRIIERKSYVIRNGGVIDATQRRHLWRTRKIEKAKDRVASQGLCGNTAKGKREKDDAYQLHEVPQTNKNPSWK
jgi:hypothetical protein